MLANLRFSLPVSLSAFLGLALLDLYLTAAVKAYEGRSLPPIHWNMSNPMFKTSNFQHIIEVRLHDQIDFVCPHFARGTSASQYEYYIVHMVSRIEYEDCNIHPDKKAVLIVNCSQPNQKSRFTLLFESFHAIPNVPEFTRGGVYYFITTSTGKQKGLGNFHRGACYHRNMKVTIKVRVEHDDVAPSKTTTTTTTRPTTTTTLTSTSALPTHPSVPVRRTQGRTITPHKRPHVIDVTSTVTPHKKLTIPPKPTVKKKVEDKEEETNQILVGQHQSNTSTQTRLYASTALTIFVTMLVSCLRLS